ncbi:uncharacterized protein LOC123216594 [Mangifera indica]|uniref:uncharacterized protein LOC123216594 n=1 Tax=Mangifera indica TaxID=29780 RepID=UPI001CF99AD1|nr:uncharacterized protein LOC123216594 [Mangifera indica]
MVPQVNLDERLGFEIHDHLLPEQKRKTIQFGKVVAPWPQVLDRTCDSGTFFWPSFARCMNKIHPQPKRPYFFFFSPVNRVAEEILIHISNGTFSHPIEKGLERYRPPNGILIRIFLNYIIIAMTDPI